jgi:hypothetical protein
MDFSRLKRLFGSGAEMTPEPVAQAPAARKEELDYYQLAREQSDEGLLDALASRVCGTPVMIQPVAEMVLRHCQPYLYEIQSRVQSDEQAHPALMTLVRRLSKLEAKNLGTVNEWYALKEVLHDRYERNENPWKKLAAPQLHA